VLTELAVHDLGVVSELRLAFGPGLSAVTGETGAGKTLIVDAIGLLTGSRAESFRVRAGAEMAVVEGRFVDPDGAEVVLRREVPADGRSRGYVDGRMATASTLAERGALLVDLHAQHAQQALLTVAGQRAALDHFAHIDLGPLLAARAEAHAIQREISALGGDAATRARESEVLRFQLAELDEAGVVDPGEDERLADEQALLTDVAAHREQAASALGALTDELGALDSVGAATAAVADRTPFALEHDRLAGIAAELADVAAELRHRAEGIVDDPERLAVIRERRQLLATLQRKYGDGTIAGLIAAHADLAQRLDDLERHDERATALAAQLAARHGEIAHEAAEVAARRRAAAPELAERVQQELRELAMPQARLDVEVAGDDPADDVRFLLAANPGSPPLPLAKVASGGELARTMLALRLVLAADQDTIVFDEVDAGIGGSAATAVGAALARLGRSRQVLVVTHLAQVAAAATVHVGVTKDVDPRGTSTSARVLDPEERVVELSRMLSGQPTSAAALAHARELIGGGDVRA
jgi:DNA repair protein RecN (Recombination protein N)